MVTNTLRLDHQDTSALNIVKFASSLSRVSFQDESSLHYKDPASPSLRSTGRYSFFKPCGEDEEEEEEEEGMLLEDDLLNSGSKKIKLMRVDSSDSLQSLMVQ